MLEEKQTEEINIVNDPYNIGSVFGARDGADPRTIPVDQTDEGGWSFFA